MSPLERICMKLDAALVEKLLKQFYLNKLQILTFSLRKKFLDFLNYSQEKRLQPNFPLKLIIYHELKALEGIKKNRK